MAFDAHANLAYSSVANNPSPAASGTSLTVQTGDGALFPTAPFNCTVWPVGALPLKSNAEIVRVTAKSGDVFTISRAQEGTTARSIQNGDQIANSISAKVITDIEALVSPLESGQIPFPAVQVSSSNANTLDDYEEGTWTPVLGGSTGTSGQSYSLQYGAYTKIGRLVVAAFEVVLTGKGTITGVCMITGFPFAVLTSSATAPFSGPMRFTLLATNWVNVGLYPVPGLSAGYLIGNTAAAGTNATNLATGDINNNSTIGGTVAYFTAT